MMNNFISNTCFTTVWKCTLECVMYGTWKECESFIVSLLMEKQTDVRDRTTTPLLYGLSLFKISYRKKTGYVFLFTSFFISALFHILIYIHFHIYYFLSLIFVICIENLQVQRYTQQTQWLSTFISTLF